VTRQLYSLTSNGSNETPTGSNNDEFEIDQIYNNEENDSSTAGTSNAANDNSL